MVMYMKSAFVTRFLPIVMAATGIAVASSAYSPANAYAVGQNGQTAGNPASPLYNISLQGGDISINGDVGRQLEPITWLVPANGTNPSVNLSAKADIRVKSFSSNLLSLAINLSNTTVSSFQSAIVSFGFGVSPDATGVTLEQNGSEKVVFDKAQLGGNFTGGFKNIDICVLGANNCSGGNVNEGLQSGGNFDTFVLNIAGSFGKTPSVTLSDFPLKFQSQDGSYEPAGVPEPLTVVGSGLALGFGVLFNREVSKRRNKVKIKS